jgi:hypothetical protein
LINVLTGIIAIIFAGKFKSILDILLYSYNFWSPVVLTPLVMAILGFKTKAKHFSWCYSRCYWRYYLEFYFGKSSGIGRTDYRSVLKLYCNICLL